MNEKLKIIVTEHAPSRAEGIIESIANPTVDAQVVQLYKGDSLPSVLDVDAVISSGGPMGVYEMDKPEYDFLNAEAEFIADMIAQGKAVLGVCLGHQLLSKVLGSDVAKSIEKAEFGWSKITLTDEGKKDELFEGIKGEIDSFHYHQDSVLSLPPGTSHLAFTDKSPIQAIRYSTKPVWGVQFHPEVSAEFAQEVLLARREILEKDTGMDVFLSIQQGFEADHGPRKQIFYNFLKALKS